MKRTVVVGVLAWVGAIVAGSTMTWATINTAGQEVLSGGSVTAGGTPTSPTGANRTETALPSADATRGADPDPGPPRTPSPGSSEAEPTAPEPDPSKRDPAGASPAQTPQPGAVTPVRTSSWRGGAGSLVVRCEEAAIALLSATPSDGYSVDVRERGPEEVEVRFESDEAETRVDAFCVAGRSRFEVDADD